LHYHSIWDKTKGTRILHCKQAICLLCKRDPVENRYTVENREIHCFQQLARFHQGSQKAGEEESDFQQKKMEIRCKAMTRQQKVILERKIILSFLLFPHGESNPGLLGENQLS
jgi:hypothetical protein